MKFTDRLVHGWNAFIGRDPTYKKQNIGEASSYNPSRRRMRRGNERSIVAAIYNRIAIDVASIPIWHVRLDDQGRYVDTIEGPLQDCLTIEPNLDQIPQDFVQDIVVSLCDEGVVAIVPTDTSDDPTETGSYKITSLRVGKIVEWFPQWVKVEVYDENSGKKKNVNLPKRFVSIVQNPFYAIMNEPNSTLQRLIRKLNLLDNIDERNGSDKLDLIIQLPYTTRSDIRKDQAEKRRKDIEVQLSNSKYGVAYIDATEKVIQLNRSLENQLLAQVEKLQATLYAQLGLTEDILNGKASEDEMNHYFNNTIAPIISAITAEMHRKFLTKNARSRGEAIRFYQDPFKLIPTSKLPDIVDKFTRNEILSTNEVRQIIGRRPSDDPRADMLVNKNIAQSNMEEQYPEEEGEYEEYE